MAVGQWQLCRHRSHRCARCCAAEAVSPAHAGDGRCSTQQRSSDGGRRLRVGVESPGEVTARIVWARIMWARVVWARAAHIGGQQLLEEAADFARAIDEVNLQDPVAWGAFFVRLAQLNRISVPNRKMFRVLRPAFMRETTD